MHSAFKAILALIAGTALGLAATWFTVVRGGGLPGGVSDGPWRTSLATGSSEGGPYLRAAVAVHGLLALGRGETIYYTAVTDSAGGKLSGDCVYIVGGRDPPTRWWSITAYGADDFLIPNTGGRYSASKNSVRRGTDGAFAVTVSRRPQATDWIAVDGGAFSLSLRLYNPAPGVAGDPVHVKLPAIDKVSCT
jgi:hypothetical protein